MSRKFRELTEARIREAETQGKLRGLAGEGKPLPDRPGDAFIDPGDAIGHRIMAEAGALPEEIRLKRALDAARQVLRAAAPKERKTAMARVADLEMKLGIAQDARRKSLE